MMLGMNRSRTMSRSSDKIELNEREAGNFGRDERVTSNTEEKKEFFETNTSEIGAGNDNESGRRVRRNRSGHDGDVNYNTDEQTLSENLLNASKTCRWNEVHQLLKEGANPNLVSQEVFFFSEVI
jgi:hypothetical protein